MQQRDSNSEPSQPTAIGYLIDFFYQGGGTEKQLATVINNLDRCRFEPFVFILRPLDNERPLVPADVDCQIEYLNVKRFLSLMALRGLFRLVRLLRKHRITILQVFFIDSNLLGVLAARLAGIRRIIVSRRDMGWWDRGGYHFWANRVNRLAPYCLANSEAVKEAVVKSEPFRPEQIRVIPNGIDPPAAGAGTFPFDRYAIGDRERLVAIVANLKPIKQLDIFLRIAARLNRDNTRFVILGWGPLEKQLRELTNELGIAPRVIFHHTVHGVFDLLSRTEVGVLTSQSEGLSNVLIEYALAGLPSVAFDTGGNREVIKDGVTGYLVPPYDEQIMTEKISLLLGDDELRTRMGKAASQRVSKKFSVRRMMTSTESYYQEVATCDYYSSRK